MIPATLGDFVHAYVPHSGTALYITDSCSAALCLLIVRLRCMWTGSTKQLAEKWIIATACAGAMIPTFFLLMVVPIDPDLAQHVLDDKVVVAIAGLYGVVETLKDISAVAADARLRKDGH